MRFKDYAPVPTYVDTLEKVEACIQHCLKPDRILGVDTETLGLLKNEDGTNRYNMTDEVVVMGLSPDEGSRYLIPRKYLHLFRPVLEAPTKKALANAKFDAHRIANSCGSHIHGRWFDIVHADYLVDEDTRENRHGLKSLAADYFGYEMVDYTQLFGTMDPRSIVPGHPLFEKYLDYASLDPWATRLLALHHEDLLKEIIAYPADAENGLEAYNYYNMYYDVEEPQIRELFRMERRGVYVDKGKLIATGIALDKRIAELAIEINKVVGYPINPGSARQVAKYFFEYKTTSKPLYQPLSFTAKGAAQCNETLFEHLAYGPAQDPVAQLIMEYKSCTKLNGTYVRGMLKYIHKDGRIHTNYGTTKTTGRLSSTEPNLQNLPRPENDPYGIRGLFIPEPGNILIIADYSQIEMRILAEISGDPTMIKAINDGLDMHSFTASKVLGCDYADFIKLYKSGDKKAKEDRTAFKKTGFGIVYGITKIALSVQLSQELKRFVSPDEAQHYINLYLGQFPGVRTYINQMHFEARTYGRVQTMCGKFRRLSKAKTGLRHERGHAERQAQNAPIQGSAADIVKRAMILIGQDQRLADLGWILLHQIHDELILEGPIETADEALEIVRYYMENPVYPPLSVPLTAEPKKAESWLEK